jgi:hydroxymethylpyrimidine pyrophosphatase-like HAD family hydrolase
MRYLALATDYDGTLAGGGTVAQDTWEAVHRLRESGRKVVLVTGRELEDLQRVCPPLDRLDCVVAENGGLLYQPQSRETVVLGPPPPPAFLQALRDRGLSHLGIGHTIVATVEPYHTLVMEVIHDLGLELQVIFNKGAVMVLPPGVNKASGLQAALDELGLSPHNVVGIGDAENDHAFLNLCECSAAVANALEMLKQHADIVTAGDHGHGVIELIDELVADDLPRRDIALTRHHILLGRATDGGEVALPPYGTVALAAGPSGSGKSTATTGLLERLAEAGYQVCVIDPEGDYQEIAGAVILGDPQHAPSVDEVLQLLRNPRQNVVVNFLHIPMSDRPLFCAGLLLRIHELRAQTARPHWLVFDEAHHLFPADWAPVPASLPHHLETALLITVHPDEVSPQVLQQVNTILAVGKGPGKTLARFARATGTPPPACDVEVLAAGNVVVWQPDTGGHPPFVVQVQPGKAEHHRHTRKYAEGQLPPDRSFYFRGPEGKLNLRAYNLLLFLELAQGVDDDTWQHHLYRGDYSRWFRDSIRDEDLANEAAAVEEDKGLSAAESRERIAQAVTRTYTLPANPSLPKRPSGSQEPAAPASS